MRVTKFSELSPTPSAQSMKPRKASISARPIVVRMALRMSPAQSLGLIPASPVGWESGYRQLRIAGSVRYQAAAPTLMPVPPLARWEGALRQRRSQRRRGRVRYERRAGEGEFG